MHVLWSSAHADDNSGPGGLLLEEIPGILNIGADREPVAGEITIRQPQESADHPAEEMSERRDHSKNLTGTIRIRRCAKSFILQVYDVLARHSSSFDLYIQTHHPHDLILDGASGSTP